MSAHRVVAAGIAIALVAVAAACSSFDTSDVAAEPDASIDAPSVDANDESAIEASTDASAPRASRIYVFGGYPNSNGSALVREAYSAAILADDSLGPWEAAPLLDVGAYFGATAVTTSGRMVLAGGHRAAGDAAFTSENNAATVTTANLDPLTKFVVDAPLPLGSASGAATGSGERIFYGGGQAAESLQRAEVYVTSFDTNGALAPWTPAGMFPEPRAAHALFAIGSRLYLAGGVPDPDDGAFIVRSETHFTSIGTDGTIGDWTKTGDLPIQLWLHHGVVARGRAYVIGGRLADGQGSASVFVATPSETGTLEWGSAAPLPTAEFGGCAVAANGTIYVLGGNRSNGPSTNAYRGSIGSNGAVSWSEVTALPGPRVGMGCAAR